jgi:hypothetical protein
MREHIFVEITFEARADTLVEMCRPGNSIGATLMSLERHRCHTDAVAR